MKKIPLIVVSLLFLLTFSSYAQDYKTSIEKQFGEYYGLIIKGEIEKSMDYVPDEFFAVFPKQQMIDVMKQLLNQKDFEYRINDYKIKSFKQPKQINNKHYVVFDYNSTITIKFNELEGEKAGLVKLSLANTFGTDNVQLDEKTKVFTINSYKKSCAISADGLNGWKFINIETKQRLILDKILPKQILEEI